MANDFIKLTRGDSAATEMSEFLAWVKDLRSVYTRGVSIRAKMQRMFDDSGGAASIDWSTLQTIFGVPVRAGNSVGDTASGKDIYTYVNGAVGAMEGAFQTNAAKEVTERVG